MIVIAFGANMDGVHGAPHKTFQKALEALKQAGLRVEHCSSLWDTSPVGTDEAQPRYTNAVFSVETDLAPKELLNLLMEVEANFGRKRTTRNAPRSIDLDLICYHDLVLNEGDDLILPHPRMEGRAFVLLPLQDIAPDWRHPVSDIALSELIAALPKDQEARKLEDAAA